MLRLKSYHRQETSCYQVPRLGMGLEECAVCRYAVFFLCRSMQPTSSVADILTFIPSSYGTSLLGSSGELNRMMHDTNIYFISNDLSSA